MQTGGFWTTHDGMVRVADSGGRDFIVSRERIWGEELASGQNLVPDHEHTSPPHDFGLTSTTLPPCGIHSKWVNPFP